MVTAYNVSQAAAIVGVSPSSLRNWCRQYAAHLSPGASPPAGTERVLTPADVATLQYIKAQRDALKDYDAIIAELSTMPLDVAATPYIDVEATLQPTAPPQQPQAPLQAVDVLAALQSIADDRYSQLQRRLDDMERRQGDKVLWFAFGVVVGVLLVGVVAITVLAGAWWR